MRLFSKISISAAALLALSAVASAQVLGTYDFSQPGISPGDQASEPVTTADPNANFTDIVRSPDLTPSAGTNSISSSNFHTAGEGAFDFSDSFYAFSVAPDAGFTMTLTGIDFSERRSGTGIRDIAIRSSLDSFAANIFSVTVPDETVNRRQSVTLGAEFASLTSTVTFRIYGFNAEGTAGTWRLGTSGAGTTATPSNLIVFGSTTPIVVGEVAPEPATFALLALGVAGAVVARRRK